MVSIRKFRIIVLVSNRIESKTEVTIRFEISNIRTALVKVRGCVDFVLWPVSIETVYYCNCHMSSEN